MVEIKTRKDVYVITKEHLIEEILNDKDFTATVYAISGTAIGALEDMDNMDISAVVENMNEYRDDYSDYDVHRGVTVDSRYDTLESDNGAQIIAAVINNDNKDEALSSIEKLCNMCFTNFVVVFKSYLSLENWLEENKTFNKKIADKIL